MLWLTLAAAGCRSDANDTQPGDALMSGILAKAGWSKEAERLPAELRVDAWLAAQATSGNLSGWHRQTASGEGTVWSRDSGGSDRYRFGRSTPDGLLAYLDADPIAAARFGALRLSAELNLQSLTRLAELDRAGGGAVLLRWEGCLINRGTEPLQDLFLRASLVGQSGNPAWPVVGIRGRSKHSTFRSGIPARIGVGETFCVSLNSRKLPKDQVDAVQGDLRGVLDAVWTDSRGRRRFGVAALLPLEWDNVWREATPKLAVVMGGRMRSPDKESPWLDLPNPELLRFRHREGNRLQAVRFDKRRVLVPVKNVVAIYPDRDEALRDDLRQPLDSLIRAVLMGDNHHARSLFIEGEGFLSGDALDRDLARRFPPREGGDFMQVKIRPLELIERDDTIQLAYFVWVPDFAGKMWQAFDVIQARRGAGGWRFIAEDRLPERAVFTE